MLASIGIIDRAVGALTALARKIVIHRSGYGNLMIIAVGAIRKMRSTERASCGIIYLLQIFVRAGARCKEDKTR